MNLKILSWNVRGLNDRNKRHQVGHLIKLWGVNVIYLQETKLYIITKGIFRSLWGIQHVDWSYLGSEGAFRGIVLMWDRRVVEKVDEAVGLFSVSCKLRSIVDQYEWALFGFYGPQTDRERRLM